MGLAMLELFQPVIEVAAYCTAKPIVPLVSFGTARAQDLTRDEGLFAWHGFKRGAEGKVVVQAEVVSIFGIAIWIGVILATVQQVCSIE